MTKRTVLRERGCKYVPQPQTLGYPAGRVRGTVSAVSVRG